MDDVLASALRSLDVQGAFRAATAARPVQVVDTTASEPKSASAAGAGAGAGGKRVKKGTQRRKQRRKQQQERGSGYAEKQANRVVRLERRSKRKQQLKAMY